MVNEGFKPLKLSPITVNDELNVHNEINPDIHIENCVENFKL